MFFEAISAAQKSEEKHTLYNIPINETFELCHFLKSDTLLCESTVSIPQQVRTWERADKVFCTSGWSPLIRPISI